MCVHACALTRFSYSALFRALLSIFVPHKQFGWMPNRPKRAQNLQAVSKWVHLNVREYQNGDEQCQLLTVFWKSFQKVSSHRDLLTQNTLWQRKPGIQAQVKARRCPVLEERSKNRGLWEALKQLLEKMRKARLKNKKLCRRGPENRPSCENVFPKRWK